MKNFGEDCKHFSFISKTRIGRLTSEEGGPVTSYICDLQIECKDCGKPFMFKGVPYGVLLDQPSMNIDKTELRIPIEPCI